MQSIRCNIDIDLESGRSPKHFIQVTLKGLIFDPGINFPRLSPEPNTACALGAVECQALLWGSQACIVYLEDPRGRASASSLTISLIKLINMRVSDAHNYD